MGKLIFITGGVRSGKSSFAGSIAKEEKKNVLFIATAFPSDEEMKERIENHRKERPSNWKTFEVTDSLQKALEIKGCEIAILDCLTLYVSRRMDEIVDVKLVDEIEEFIKELKEKFQLSILISNEVGSGVVPHTYSGRKFADILGSVNQRASLLADEVFLMVAGIPVCLKGRK